jgi:hypothetical protein
MNLLLWNFLAILGALFVAAFVLALALCVWRGRRKRPPASASPTRKS